MQRDRQKRSLFLNVRYLMSKIDIIIPLYKPDKQFLSLLETLVNQTVDIHKIILMNTEEKYFDQLINGTDILEKYKHIISVTHLSKLEFDHGGTRNAGVEKSNADIFVMMTQDAMPADEFMLENLLKPLEEEKTAVSYARQLPSDDSGIIEGYTRSFNYPEEAHIQKASDLEKKGIKTFFCSNVCAAYRRDVFNELGGFIKHTIFNEDMIFAAKAIKNGWQIAYAAQARVVHSHNYTVMQQLRRNFDLAVSQADNPEAFAGIKSESEGKKMVKEVTKLLFSSRKIGLLFYFYMQCFFKYTGYLLGKNYKHLPKKMILYFTMSQSYWKKE